MTARPDPDRPEATGTHLVAVMGALGNGLATIEEIAGHLPMPKPKVSNAAGRLIARGLVARVEAGQYRLTEAGKAHLAAGRPLRSGPRGKHTGQRRSPPDTLRQRAWQAMRFRGTRSAWTIGELVMLADDGASLHPERNLGRWIGYLVRAGYVAELPRRVKGTAPTSPGHKVYRLIRDSGERAPVYLESGHVRDGNTGEVTPCR